MLQASPGFVSRERLTSLLLWLIYDEMMDIRFHTDPQTGLSHVHKHGVTEREVEEILSRPGEDRPGREGSRVAIGRTQAGRYLRVIYVPDPEPDSLFVVTAYELRGKALLAFRRRRQRRRK